MPQQTIAELFDLKGKGAVVTGGAMGIGKGIALRLVEAGASVMIADVNLEVASITVDEIRGIGGKAEAIQADARSPADGKMVAQAVVKAFGSYDILVNNAGIYMLSPALSTTEELWDNVIDTNLKGVFFYSQAAAQVMAQSRRGGKIINLASVDAIKPTGMVAHYNASKAGVLILTKALAREFAPMNILVNAVAPGGIQTPGTQMFLSAGEKITGLKPGELLESYLQRIPLGRLGEPDDIGKVVLFLASGAADYMTGEIIVVDGGQLLS